MAAACNVMTDGYLMDADCIHGLPWYDCEACMRPDFPHWALGIAKAVSKRSEDPYVQVGSVVATYDWHILGVGYNGLPAGVNMSPEWWGSRAGRRPFIIHAEVNALRSVTPEHAGLTIVTTHIPCSTCMPMIGSFKIGVVYFERLLGEAHDLDEIRQIAELMGIKLQQIGDVHGDAS